MDKIKLTLGILIGLGFIALALIYLPNQIPTGDLSGAIKRMAVGH